MIKKSDRQLFSVIGIALFVFLNIAGPSCILNQYNIRLLDYNNEKKNPDENATKKQQPSMPLIESHIDTTSIPDESDIGLRSLRETDSRRETSDTSILVKNVTEMNKKFEDKGNGTKIVLASPSKLHNTTGILPLPSNLSTLPLSFIAAQNLTQGGKFIISKNDTGLYSSFPPQEHPFAGARFANGSWGLIADVFAPRRTIINRFETEMKAKKAKPFISSYLPLGQGEVLHDAPNGGTCRLKPKVWSLLTDHVKVSKAHSTLPINNKGQKILCAVYTHDKSRAKIQGIVETWGWRCDGFFAASTKTIEDPNKEGYGMIDLPHKGPEEYGNMWQKSRSIWGYIYKNYLHDFEYFYVAGDDTHLIVENLHLFLSQINATADETPLYIGARAHTKYIDFAVGGGGYLVNRKALQILFQNQPNCHMNDKISAEDRIMGKCLKMAGVHLNQTVDEGNRQLFFHSSPQEHATFNHTLPQENRYLKKMYDYYDKVYGHKTGINIVSNQAIAFHYIVGKENMKKHHAALYNKKCISVDKYLQWLGRNK